MLIGYVRPFQNDLKCQQQIKQLKNQHCDKIFIEHHASAKRRNKLDEMMHQLNGGDKIVITSLYAIADSTHHLVEILEMIREKGASLLSLDEAIDTEEPNSYSFEYIVKHLAQFQSDVISEKTKKGLHKAKEKGVSTGRPRKPDANVQKAIMMYESKKYTLAEIRQETGISKSTLYRYLES